MLKLRKPEGVERFVTPKSVYMLYLMLKRHFTGSYDVVKYKWRLSVSDAAYQKRKDKYFFARLAKKHNLGALVELFVSNLTSNSDAWVGELADADAEVCYRENKGKFIRANQILIDDIKTIICFQRKKAVQLKKMFEVNKTHGSSYIFELLQCKLISPESFLLLDSFLDLINKHDHATDNIVWTEHSNRLKAYKKLLDIDSARAREIFISTVKDSQI